LLELICVLGSASFAASPADAEKVERANTDFTFTLLKQIAREQPGTNIFISPYGASSLLEMIANGAAGKTRQEMEAVLGIAGLQRQTVNEAHRDLERYLKDAQANVVLRLANSMWYRPGVELKPGFISVNQQFYGATLQSLDFTDPRAMGILNDWAAESTQGKIKRLMDGPIRGDTEVLLAQAIYFKASWLHRFETRETRQRAFRAGSGRPEQCMMMEQRRKFEYFETTRLQVIRMPYEGERIGMYLLLPRTNVDLLTLAQNLDGQTWQTQLAPLMRSREGFIAMPRFKLEYQIKLNQTLKALGMKSAFDVADFSVMSARPLRVDEVKQKTFVDVNEEGTEAAAITTGAMTPMAVTPRELPFEMIVDRPFLFLIADNLTRTILFAGMVFDPLAGGSEN